MLRGPWRPGSSGGRVAAAGSKQPPSRHPWLQIIYQRDAATGPQQVTLGQRTRKVVEEQSTTKCNESIDQR